MDPWGCKRGVFVRTGKWLPPPSRWTCLVPTLGLAFAAGTSCVVAHRKTCSIQENDPNVSLFFCVHVLGSVFGNTMYKDIVNDLHCSFSDFHIDSLASNATDLRKPQHQLANVFLWKGYSKLRARIITLTASSHVLFIVSAYKGFSFDNFRWRSWATLTHVEYCVIL